jgi:ATP-binding cassette subfamily E protein 1
MVHRVAALDKDNCQSKKCGLACVRFCPINKTGSKCIVLGEDIKAVINESLCTGCGICIKKCPFQAISIVNLAEELIEAKVHQYDLNSFRLYRLPTLRKGSIIGLVGRNGVGKTTAVNILSGSLKPNLGRYDSPPDWDGIIDFFKGTEFKMHFEKIASKALKVSVKPQAVYLIPRVWKGKAGSLLKRFDERGVTDTLVEDLNLSESLDKPLDELSGGEFQRLSVAVAAARDSDLYLFDEPSSYNDVFQRLAVANVIQKLAQMKRMILLVEHDLTLLDYLSDYVHILYGQAGAYGIISGVQSSRTGINILLDGYLPAENVRFREKPVTFDIRAPIGETVNLPVIVEYSEIEKTYPNFKLKVTSGCLKRGEVLGILGANALGKTTFLKMVAGVEEPDIGKVQRHATVAYKPQYLSSDYEGCVKNLLEGVSADGMDDENFQNQVSGPLNLRRLLDKDVRELSGGELQKVAIVACLMQNAEIYAFDEPSAFIDVEDRIVLAEAIQKFVKFKEKSALIVDHDIQLIDIVSDSLIIFTGKPALRGEVSSPMPKNEGMNAFLKDLGITYRRDVESGRPRVNKPKSKIDRSQKNEGRYYYVGVDRKD